MSPVSLLNLGAGRIPAASLTLSNATGSATLTSVGSNLTAGGTVTATGLSASSGNIVATSGTISAPVGGFTGALTGNASTATNATQLNGQAASFYTNAANITGNLTNVSTVTSSGLIKYPTYAFSFSLGANSQFTSCFIPWSTANASYPVTTISTSGSYQVPVSGLYMFSVNLNLAVSPASQYRCGIYRTTGTTPSTTITFASIPANLPASMTLIAPMIQENNTYTLFNASSSCVTYCLAGDYVNVGASLSATSANVTYSWPTIVNNFSGHLISPY